MIIKTTSINASIDKIFDTLLDCRKLIEIYPSLIEVEYIEALPNGGNKLWWVYKFAGHYIHGTSEEIEIIPNQKIVSKIDGGIDCIITWTFQLKKDVVWVTLTMDYSLPFHLISKMAERIAEKMVGLEAENTLMNLMFEVEDLASLGL